MKIIQSFAEFDEGSPYFEMDNPDYDINIEDNKKYLNFYTFLLSCLTLQKYYGKVTMYCNQKAYNRFIKYIPYSEIIIVENNNSFDFWSCYKVDIIKLQTEDFIHIDNDVFIFDDLFSEFINSKKYDVISQDIISKDLSEDIHFFLDYYGEFVSENKDFFIKNNIIDPNIYDKKCISCGTVGMNLKIRDQWVKIYDMIKYHYENDLFKDKPYYITTIVEELALYFVVLKNNLNVYRILPDNLTIIHGIQDTGNLMKYTHMWFNSKFNPENIKLIKNKIYTDFPNYINVIEKFENENTLNDFESDNYAYPIGLENLIKNNPNYGKYY